MNDQERRLAEVVKEIEACKICELPGIGVPVPGEGSAEAQVMFVGEAPGKQESVSGRPFIGRSGKFLRTLIKGLGLREEEVYITSPVKYLPKTGTPTPPVIKHGVIHLQKQIEIIQPKVVVLLGRVATEAVLETPARVLKDHGTVRKKDDEPDRSYFLTVHPAAAIRFGSMRQAMEQDFDKLKKLLQHESILPRMEGL